MTEALKTAVAPAVPARSDESEKQQHFETVRDIYDAMYRGEIDEAKVVELLSELHERNYSWPARMMAMISRR